MIGFDDKDNKNNDIIVLIGQRVFKYKRLRVESGGGGLATYRVVYGDNGSLFWYRL